MYQDFYDRLHAVVAPETSGSSRTARCPTATRRPDPPRRAAGPVRAPRPLRPPRHRPRLGFTVAVPASYRSGLLVLAGGRASTRASVLDGLLERWRAEEDRRAEERERQSRLDEPLYEPSREPSAGGGTGGAGSGPGRPRPQYVRTQPCTYGGSRPGRRPRRARRRPRSPARGRSARPAPFSSHPSDLGHTVALGLAAALAERGRLEPSTMVAAEASYERRLRSARSTGRWPNATEVVAALFPD
ncbi:hypothetical protein NKH77_48215 [Streptomyces sp. M19]